MDTRMSKEKEELQPTLSWKWISSAIFGFTSISTVFFQYIEHQLLMGRLEYLGYSLMAVGYVPSNLISTIFESVKFALLIAINCFLLLQVTKLRSLLQKVISRIRRLLRKKESRGVSKRIRKSRKRVKGLCNANISIESTFAYIITILLFLSVSILVLEVTAVMIETSFERIIRLQGYSEGVSHIEYDLENILGGRQGNYANPLSSFEIRPDFSKYAVCSIPYLPAAISTVYMFIRKYSDSIKSVMIVVVLLFSYVPILNILITDYSGAIYTMAQERLENNIYHDTITLNGQRYILAYENETMFFLTKCTYRDSGEYLVVDVAERLCIEKKGVIVEKFIAHSGLISNFDHYLRPLDESD